MGAASAYYLTQKGATNVTVIERSEVASAASGKAGGFLAGGWGNNVTNQLHTVSFGLHKELATQLNLETYRQITTLSCNASKNVNSCAKWLDGKVSTKIMDKATAQVTPKEITTKLMEHACQKGAQLVIGVVDGIQTVPKDEGFSVSGVKLADGTVLPCDKLLLTMGPWTTIASDWLNIPIPIQGIKSSSIIYNNIDRIKQDPYALFCSEDTNGCHLEVYPRPNGEVYVCGIGGSDTVNANRLQKGGDCDCPEKIVSNPGRVKAACRSLGAMSSDVKDVVPDVAQACMRPCPPDALPIMGEVPNVAGVYIAAGHNCWGILWGPATGLAMSELILFGKSQSIDLSPFSPARFMAEQATRGRKKNEENIGEQW